MTYEKALEWMRAVEHTNNHLDDRLLEAFRVAIRALDIQAKSHWHDLRKDPEDFPKKSGEYLCAWKHSPDELSDSVFCVYDPVYRGPSGRNKKSRKAFLIGGINDRCDITKDIIAWKEKEQFDD